MKRTMGMAATFVCAAAFSAHAQSPTTAMKSSMADKPSDVIAVSGCLQSGQSSSTAASNGMESYILMTNSMSGSSTAAGAGGTTAGTAGSTVATGSRATTGTSGTTEAVRMVDGGKMAHPGATYMLDGNDSELKNHVGHRIEVTGSVAGSMSGMNHGTTGSPATSTAASSSSSGSSSDKMTNVNQTLNVTSIKMISADCSAK